VQIEIRLLQCSSDASEAPEAPENKTSVIQSFRRNIICAD